MPEDSQMDETHCINVNNSVKYGSMAIQGSYSTQEICINITSKEWNYIKKSIQKHA
jgi:hypothetical protein